MDLEEIKNKLRNPTQYGQATPEEARFAFESGYMGGPETQKYYAELGLLEPPKDIVAPVTGRNYNGMPSNLQQYATNSTSAGYYEQPQDIAEQPQDTLPAEQAQAAQPKLRMPDFSKFKDTDVFNRGMQAWSPLAPSILKGGDKSGFASGERAKSGIYTQNAAENAKIVQWNKQHATDNTLADKVAAAQASGQWRQNANALGAEGGASVVASQNQAATPDIMTQKQYQTQQMQDAKQGLAEVNRNKLEANAAQQNANITDYNTQYNESRDAYAHNLATAKDTQNKDTGEKKEEPKAETTVSETTEKPDGKVESTDTVDNTQQAAAEVNQQSQAMENATQEVSEQQELQDLADEINGIHNAVESMKSNSQTNAESLRKQKARYDKIKPRYDELASKSKNPPPQASTPDFSMFDPKLSEVPSSTKVSSSILSGVNQRF